MRRQINLGLIWIHKHHTYKQNCVGGQKHFEGLHTSIELQNIPESTNYLSAVCFGV